MQFNNVQRVLFSLVIDLLEPLTASDGRYESILRPLSSVSSHFTPVMMSLRHVLCKTTWREGSRVCVWICRSRFVIKISEIFRDMKHLKKDLTGGVQRV